MGAVSRVRGILPQVERRGRVFTAFCSSPVRRARLSVEGSAIRKSMGYLPKSWSTLLENFGITTPRRINKSSVSMRLRPAISPSTAITCCGSSS